MPVNSCEFAEDINKLLDLTTRFYIEGTADQYDGDSCFVCGGTLDRHADNEGHRDDCEDQEISNFLDHVEHKYKEYFNKIKEGQLLT